jgi:hypothetical protein
VLLKTGGQKERSLMRQILVIGLMLTTCMCITSAMAILPTTNPKSVSSEIDQDLVGARECFNVGSEGCCKEIGTLVVISGVTGAWLATLVGGIYYVWACTS